MYGGTVFESGEFRFERQALHAYEIRFVHPVTLETMTLRAPLPRLGVLFCRSPTTCPAGCVVG